MKLIISEKQLKTLIKKSSDKEIKEADDSVAATAAADAIPAPGTSEVQKGGQGYPKVSTWEEIVGSKLTRGPANQIKVTKWSETVGSQLKRDAANQLSEQDYPGQPSGPYKRTTPPKIQTPLQQSFQQATTPQQTIPFAYHQSQKPLTYQTFWGTKIEIPYDSTAILWKTTDNIQQIFSTGKQNENGEYIWKDGNVGPSEDDLKKFFKEGTLREFTIKRDGIRYQIVMDKVKVSAGTGLYGLGQKKEKTQVINEQMVPYSLMLQSPQDEDLGEAWEPRQGYFTIQNGKYVQYNPHNYIHYSTAHKISDFSEEHKGLYNLIQFATILGIAIATGGQTLWVQALSQAIGSIPFSLVEIEKGNNLGAVLGLLIMCTPLVTRSLGLGLETNIKALNGLKRIVPELSTVKTASDLLKKINTLNLSNDERVILTKLLKFTPKELEKIVGKTLMISIKNQIRSGEFNLSKLSGSQLYWWKEFLATGILSLGVIGTGTYIKTQAQKENMMNMVTQLGNKKTTEEINKEMTDFWIKKNKFY